MPGESMTQYQPDAHPSRRREYSCARECAAMRPRRPAVRPAPLSAGRCRGRARCWVRPNWRWLRPPTGLGSSRGASLSYRSTTHKCYSAASGRPLDLNQGPLPYQSCRTLTLRPCGTVETVPTCGFVPSGVIPYRPVPAASADFLLTKQLGPTRPPGRWAYLYRQPTAGSQPPS